MPIPSFLTVGCSAEFTVETPGYSSADGYTALLELANAAGKLSIESATSSGTRHTFEISAQDAQAWTAGAYVWQLSAVLEDPAEKWSIERGELQIRDSLGGSTGLDARSHARRVLDAVEATIERRATKDQLEVTVPQGDGGSISLKRLPLPDLIKLRDAYRREVRSDQQAEDLRAGRGGRRVVRVRFTGE